MYAVNSSIGRLRSNSIPIVSRFFILFFFLISTVLLSSCQTGDGIRRTTLQEGRNITYQRMQDGGWITLFLHLNDAAGPALILDVAKIEARNQSGWVTLNDKPQTIDSGKVAAGQILIARNGVLPGNYDSIRVTVNQAFSKVEGKQLPLTVVQPVIEISLPSGLKMEEGDSHSLFVTWDTETSMVGPQLFDAAMKISLQAIPLLSDLLFVACPDLNTVYVVRNDKNWVISSLGISGRPAYTFADLRRNRLYVLSIDEYSIKVVDLTQFRVVETYYIRADFPPSFMAVDPENTFAFLLDEKGKGLVKVDLTNGAIIDQVALTYRPRYAYYLADQDYLAVTPADENNVYFFNPDTLGAAGSIAVGTKPQGLLNLRNILFVAESGSNSVSAYDINTRTRRNTVEVGFAPVRLFLKNNQIYATSFASGSVTVMLPGQLNVSGEIFLGGNPLEITGSENRRWIYIGNAQKNGVHVIDANSNRLAGFIDLATSPLGMSVID